VSDYLCGFRGSVPELHALQCLHRCKFNILVIVLKPKPRESNESTVSTSGRMPRSASQQLLTTHHSPSMNPNAAAESGFFGRTPPSIACITLPWWPQQVFFTPQDPTVTPHNLDRVATNLVVSSADCNRTRTSPSLRAVVLARMPKKHLKFTSIPRGGRGETGESKPDLNLQGKRMLKKATFSRGWTQLRTVVNVVTVFLWFGKSGRVHGCPS
jgi:hypothetical protein